MDNNLLKRKSYRNILKLSKVLGAKELEGEASLAFKEITESQEPRDIRIVPTTGTNNCGGRCVIKAYVKDDIIVEIGTDEEEENPKRPQLRACVRGRGYRNTFLHPDRLKYPMKRVGKRGEGKFQRISWEEAIETIASETKRIKKEYGPGSRYVNYAWGYSGVLHPMRLGKRLLALDGGYLDFYNSYRDRKSVV